MKIRKLKSETNRQTFYNILSTAILSGINFFTIPIFTRVLGAKQYGLYSVFNSWLLILTCFMGLKTQSSLGTGLYYFRDKYKEFRSSLLIEGTVISAIIAIIHIVGHSFFLKFTSYTLGLSLVLIVCAFAHYIIEFAQVSFIYEKKANINFLISVGLSISTVGLSLLFINEGLFSESYLSRVYGTTIPYLLVAIIIWGYFIANARPSIKKEYWKYGLVLGVPIVFHALSQNILSQSDRIMLQNMGYAGTAVGIYSFFYTFTNAVSMVLNALNTSWCPFYYDYLNKQDYKTLKVKIQNYTELFTVVICGFLLLSREVCYFFSSEEYWGGMNVIPILTFAVYFTFMYQFPVNFEFYNRKTSIIASGTCSVGILNIILNYLMIPLMGIYGAALATVISYGALFATHYIIAHHIKEMKFHMKIKDFVVGAIPVCICVILFYVLSGVWIIRWILGACLGIFELYQIYNRRTIF